ncbi:MAG: hypothetical protein LUQ51_04665 [Methanothrix sp.]|nr:hypothetical protein [Methanothrix sp.]
MRTVGFHFAFPFGNCIARFARVNINQPPVHMGGRLLDPARCIQHSGEKIDAWAFTGYATRSQ